MKRRSQLVTSSPIQVALGAAQALFQLLQFACFTPLAQQFRSSAMINHVTTEQVLQANRRFHRNPTNSYILAALLCTVLSSKTTVVCHIYDLGLSENRVPHSIHRLRIIFHPKMAMWGTPQSQARPNHKNMMCLVVYPIISHYNSLYMSPFLFIIMNQYESCVYT